MADTIKVLAGDWKKATLTRSGFRVSKSTFGPGEDRSWADITSLNVSGGDPSARRGEVTFTAHFGEEILFASTSPSTYQKINTAYTAHRISVERGTKPPGTDIPPGCLVMAVMAVVVVGFFTYLLAVSDKTPHAPSGDAYSSSSQTSQEDELLEMRMKQDAQQAVKDNLRDPESATFSDLRFHKPTMTVCGLVNAKNGFGGYSGPQEFISILGEKDKTVIRPGNSDKDFVTAYKLFCKG